MINPDGVTILNNIEVDSQIAKLLVELSKSQDSELEMVLQVLLY